MELLLVTAPVVRCENCGGYHMDVGWCPGCGEIDAVMVGDFSATRLGSEHDLPLHHPWPHKQAWQCDTCNGIFFPVGEPTHCPYCEDDAA